MYHAHEYLATDALEKLCAAMPAERGDAHRLLARYVGADIAKRNYAGLHVAICLLWTENAGDAEKLLTRRLGAKPGAAAQLLAGCVNDGIFTEVKDATYLYRKGWLRDADRYYRATRMLAYGSEFHQCCARIDASFQPILLAAIRVSHRRAGRDDTGGLSKRCLPYIAALLLTSKKESEFRLTSLACRMPSKEHTAFLDRARRFVIRAGQRLQIAVPFSLEAPAKPIPAARTRREPPANTNVKGQFYKRLRPFRAMTPLRERRNTARN